MRTIVVAVRGRDEDEAALDLALDEALRRGLPLDAVHCYQLPTYGDLPSALTPARLGATRRAAEERVRAAVSRAVARVPGSEGVAVTAHAMHGDTGRCVLTLSGPAALVVVGRRGGGPLVRGARGSVSADVLHHSSAPVVLVPERLRPTADRWLRSRVVVAVDGTPASLAALDWAVAQALEWGCPLVPVLVEHEEVHDPEPVLAGLSRQAVQAGGHLVQPALLVGGTWRRLVEFVHPEDLLVLGSRGHRGLPGLIGSTSTAVGEHACCPVVVVRQGQARRETHQRSDRVRRLDVAGRSPSRGTFVPRRK